jgi:hypothetical protein
MFKRIGIIVLATIIVAGGFGLGERLGVPGLHSFVSTTEARVGRPATPVSVAGAARRTVRRCAAGVYYC